ncbi:MAG: hypothetical protein PWP62_493 [Eubacteriaceae bacterium]|jgi:Methylase involved in ubiquinone/menaquinone biosynthesis|nr:hypothetical protein [Eubacteriaceae bacterium]MDK2961082.1 hypothetical protein [Eubacteriaceae bacterium]
MMENFKEIISSKWTERAPTFDEDHATENVDLWRQTLEELIGKKGNGKVLDIGTGTGFLANMVAELGYHSVGIDFSEGMLEIGRSNSANRGTAVEFVMGDGDMLPFDDNSFDAVINSRVLWLILDPVKSIKEWMRVLKPGGVLLSFIRITTPQERAQRELENPNTKMQYPPELSNAMPLRDGTIDDHLAAYQKAGFYNPEAILLRKDISLNNDAKPWYALKGTKERVRVL